MISIRRLGPAEARENIGALADVLVDCVAGGASVSFMWPFPKAEAETFFSKVANGVAAGERILLAAFDGAALVGTVQIVTALPPNQPHRAEVAKLLVHRAARRQGVAAMLMRQAEVEAKGAGRSLLVLDTVTGGEAERLYQRLDWIKVGIIPNFALFPDGRWCDTTIFFKAV
jgi:ribosomal protein S18 acetylase RimI-like enzyme